MNIPKESTGPRFIVALDFADSATALSLTERLEPALCRLKVGCELFTRAGPALVEALVRRGFEVFLDLKFHDIPNTVAAACKAAADLGVWMVNVHAAGGRPMLEAAREALSRPGCPWLVAVTVLTSLEQADLEEVGVLGKLQEQVLCLARLAQSVELDGVVCSAQEARDIRLALGEDFYLVTPGIRLPGLNRDDQRRVVTPQQAIQAGSDYLVMGRTVTRAADPVAVLKALNEDLTLTNRQPLD